MKKNTKTEESKKRAKFLFILIILTAVLSITTTYTWFSMRTDATLSNLKVKVEVAENMQISLDGETWVSDIEIYDMSQLDGILAPDGEAQKQVTAGALVCKANSSEQTNYVPTKLLPVSSVGTVKEGKLQFVIGDLKSDTELTAVKACNEDDITKGATAETKETNNGNHPYLVFDLFIKNLSSAEAPEKLQLAKDSRVWVNAPAVAGVPEEGKDGVAGTGLEYSPRIAFIPYGNVAEVVAEAPDVRKIAATGSETAAIWEPNDKEHTSAIVASNSKINNTTQAIDTYAVKDEVASKEDGQNKIDDINSTTDSENLEVVKTIKPNYDAERKVTDDAVDLKDTKEDVLTIQPNKISRVRVYLWLEGQDPDCVNLASAGKELCATIRLTKAANE